MFCSVARSQSITAKFRVLEETRKELANKAYSMDIHPSNDDNQSNLEQENEVKIEAIK